MKATLMPCKPKQVWTQSLHRSGRKWVQERLMDRPKAMGKVSGSITTCVLPHYHTYYYSFTPSTAHRAAEW